MNYDALTRPPAPTRRLLHRLTIAVLCIAAIAGTYDWRHGKLDLSRMRHAQPADVAIAPAQPQSDPQSERKAQELLSTLQGHWTHTLLAFEKASGPDVTLLEIHPDFSKGSFEATGEARSFKALSAYIQRLNQTGLVRNTVLLHEEALSHDNVETIGFKLEGEL